VWIALLATDGVLLDRVVVIADDQVFVSRLLFDSRAADGTGDRRPVVEQNPDGDVLDLFRLVRLFYWLYS
jgi:hypothetical protein